MTIPAVKEHSSNNRLVSAIKWGEYIYLAFFTLLLNTQFLVRPLLVSWNYWPEWAPISHSFATVFSFVRCLLLPMLGAMGAVAFVVFGDSLRRNIPDLLNRKFPVGILYLLLVVLVLPLSVPYVIQTRNEIVDSYVRTIAEKNGIALRKYDSTNTALIAYAASRYDPVIDAIEKYHEENNEYPPDLETLVPDFLNETPEIYIKFGEYLSYSPVVESQFHDHSPFEFELYGHYSPEFIHGQTLKYCPVQIAPCFEGNRHFTPARINNRWILVYSSAL